MTIITEIIDIAYSCLRHHYPTTNATRHRPPGPFNPNNLMGNYRSDQMRRAVLNPPLQTPARSPAPTITQSDKKWRPEEVGYFDPSLKKKRGNCYYQKRYIL